ncbi:MAG TPA: PQQ-binding-like beta-propeller repeat protein [Microlunatus sp.]
MAEGGRSISLPSASWPALALQVSALLLGLLAALCWFAASISPVQLDAVGGAGPDLRWWSASVAVLGIGVALLTWFAATVRGLVGLLVLGLLLVGLGGAAFAFLQLVVPTANPIHPVGAAVPYAFAGFGAAGGACLLAAGSIAVSARLPSTPTRWTISPWTGALAGCTGLVLVFAAALVVVDRTQDYLLEANEYRTVGDVDREPADDPVSTLAGGSHWDIGVPGLTLMRPALTDFGIGLASGQNVIMVDRAAGTIRWRYTRSDEPGPVAVASTGGGRQVLASWGSGEVYVLDARTGERVGHWSTAGGGISILDPALPLVARTGSDGRTTIARVSAAGRDLWTHPLGPCLSSRATAAGTAVILAAHCPGPSDRLIGLDAATGHEQWSHDITGDLRAVLSGTAVVLTRPGRVDPAGSLTAIDLADGTTRWTRALPHGGEPTLPCGDAELTAGKQVAVLVCTWDLTEYPAGPQRFSSSVFGYDAVTGSPVRPVTYPTVPVVAAAVTDDERVIVACADAAEGWVLDVAIPRTSHRRLSVAPYLNSHATARGLVVFDDQVLVVDAASETLRSLR